MRNDLLINNCKLYTSNDGTLIDVFVKDGRISQVGEKAVPAVSGPVLDAGGRTLVPGFIDTHIQGAGGADILDGKEESIRTISQTLAALGTTGFLATTVMLPKIGSKHFEVAAHAVGKDFGGAQVLGIHLEGPFINVKKKGGISEENIYPSSPQELDDILQRTGDVLKIMTIAPELPGNLEVIRRLTARGVVASFGHSDANYEETKRGIDAGITHVTHLFNAMRSLHHREPGPLLAIFEDSHVKAEIIADGHHLHPSVVGLAYRLLGPERCLCITDGVPATGLEDGRYSYNGKAYESSRGTARYLDGTLIGTTLGLGQIALRFMEFTGCSFATAVDCAAKVPAKLLGLEERKGSIEVGKEADLVLLDSDYSVWATIVGGKVVFQKKAGDLD